MHRRRGVGVGRSSGSKFQKKADEMKAISLQSALETCEKLELKLTEFAKKHSRDIQNDPAFRQRFLQMCAPLGVDPLLSNKVRGSLWNKIFGSDMNDYYFELAVKIAEVCLATRYKKNGGIMSLMEVKSILETRKTKFQLSTTTTSITTKNNKKKSSTTNNNKKYSIDDLKTAISKLSKLGGGFRTIKVGKSIMVISVPTELDHDHMEIMELAQTSTGSISIEQCQEKTGWNKERCQRAIDLLLGEGMVWMDKYKGETLYWFPSIWKEGLGSEGDE